MTIFKILQKTTTIFLIIILHPVLMLAGTHTGIHGLSLNGKWQMGFGRKYTQIVFVPGIAADPTRIGADALWYKKEIKLPLGKWTSATLELKGARFYPKVYSKGVFVGQQGGRMAPFSLN